MASPAPMRSDSAVMSVRTAATSLRCEASSLLARDSKSALVGIALNSALSSSSACRVRGVLCESCVSWMTSLSSRGVEMSLSEVQGAMDGVSEQCCEVLTSSVVRSSRGVVMFLSDAQGVMGCVSEQCCGILTCSFVFMAAAIFGAGDGSQGSERYCLMAPFRCVFGGVLLCCRLLFALRLPAEYMPLIECWYGWFKGRKGRDGLGAAQKHVFTRPCPDHAPLTLMFWLFGEGGVYISGKENH